MPHNNISIFIPHLGCSHLCSFCNQHSISGAEKAPTADEVREICAQAFSQIKEKSSTEIAFFGGSFTAIPRGYMLELLEAVQDYIGEGKFCGIRISTRPDCIDDEVLAILKKYRVTAIELGVQSMSDEVLSANSRGHSARDVVNAAEKIRSFGFKLGLQMMVGLYGSDIETDRMTAEKIIALSPDTVRIYPVAILEGTRLGDLYREGVYKPYSMEQAVKLCAELILMFREKGIVIIRLGLHASDLVESQLLGGLYHPAFKELCENYIYREQIEKALPEGVKSATVYIPRKHLSKAVGQKKSNLLYFGENGISLKFSEAEELCDYEIRLQAE